MPAIPHQPVGYLGGAQHMTATKHDALLDDIARTEAELGAIDKQRRETESRLDGLRKQAARLQRPKLVTGGVRPAAPAAEAPPRIDSTAAPFACRPRTTAKAGPAAALAPPPTRANAPYA